jgi:GNAT superfamily N-acetyltransferase
MNTRQMRFDGKFTVIRPMDASYLMADREPEGVTVSVPCRTCAKPHQWPNPMYVTYYRELTDAYGACAILAWQSHEIVGFLPFVPLGCGIRLPHCFHYVDAGQAAEVEAFVPIPTSEMPRRVLSTHCLSVKHSMRRKGLGSELVRYLAGWARANGWERIQGWAFEKSDFGWIPDIVFWEKCGFKRGKARGWDEDITDPGYEYYMDL